jgi:hypothetical protein
MHIVRNVFHQSRIGLNVFDFISSPASQNNVTFIELYLWQVVESDTSTNSVVLY